MRNLAIIFFAILLSGVSVACELESAVTGVQQNNDGCKRDLSTELPWPGHS